eukprot:6182519-Pleurochrysis_carterae.AAC.4
MLMRTRTNAPPTTRAQAKLEPSARKRKQANTRARVQASAPTRAEAPFAPPVSCRPARVRHRLRREVASRPPEVVNLDRWLPYYRRWRASSDQIELSCQICRFARMATRTCGL